MIRRRVGLLPAAGSAHRGGPSVAAHRARRGPGWVGAVLACSLSLAVESGCGAGLSASAPGLAELRGERAESLSERALARWMLLEMLAPGGRAAAVGEVRERLERAGEAHYLGHFARAVDDEWHGRLKAAADHYFEAVSRAAEVREGGALERMVAWLSSSRVIALRSSDLQLWARIAPRVEQLLAAPGAIGWRARAQLAQWWLDEATSAGERPVDPGDHRLGCVTEVRLAGPFSRGAAVHLVESFAAEAPGPWPRRWPPHEVSGVTPEVLPTVARGCEVVAEKADERGVHYAETYLELSEERSLIVAVQGALAVWIDDRQVLERDPRDWGVWSRFGTQVRLAAGRHRLLARLSEPRTLVRVLEPDGSPLSLRASVDASAPYQLAAPRLEPDPNDLMRFISPSGAGPIDDPLLRFLVARLAFLEGDGDVASVVAGPLAEPLAEAAGPLLSNLAEWVSADPVYTRERGADRARELHQAAVGKDAGLWRSQLALALSQGGARSLADATQPIAALVEQFPEVPLIGQTLLNIYGRLGWDPEQERLALALLDRHPSDLGALAAALPVLRERGQWQRADEVVEKIVALDPDSELRVERALARHEWGAALAELERLSQRRPDLRRALEAKMLRVRVQAGLPGALSARTDAALEQNDENGRAWLAYGDEQLAQGNESGLRQALAEATQAGAPTQAIERAIDIVEAQTDFEPLRIDGKEVVRKYERAQRHQEGTAARVLDYAAVWVHADGSSRMLEHEIVRLQSEEAIRKFVEHRLPPGLVLHMRVIKRDGSTLQPEHVAGKPTFTFPHLEVGDYIETETVQGARPVDFGRYYPGLRWFFREENIAYARSEFVFIAPKSRPLDIEITGDVPQPVVEEDGMFVTRRWRVDESPAAVVEPLSPPVSEFLPSVRVSWGNGMERRLHVLSEQVESMVPIDPRVAQLAREIVSPVPAADPMGRARKAYRWVQDNVEKGDSEDGRQAVLGKEGNRWHALRELLRALDISAETAVVRNRLAPATLGVVSDAEAYAVPLLRIEGGGKTQWLTMQEKYAPFGYVPVEARGMPGFLIAEAGPEKIRVPPGGRQDRLEYEGEIALSPNGDAVITLRQRFIGKYAVRMRAGLERLTEQQLPEVLESRVLGAALPGARLTGHRLIGQADLEEPLVVEMQATLTGFAERRAGQLVIDPPMMPRLSQLAALPQRRTPLLIGEAMHQSARLAIRLPPSAVGAGTRTGELSFGEHRALAADRLEGHVLVLDRDVLIQAGRVQVEQYPEFQEFCQRSEGLLSGPLVVDLVGRGGSG